VHNCDFIKEPLFAAAYKLGQSTPHEWGPDLHIEWRAYVCAWAANQVKSLNADYVECGVASGIFSRTAMHYIGFEKMAGRRFYLLDTFEGIPVDQLTESEKALGLDRYNEQYHDSYEAARKTFAGYPGVRIIKGRVPDTLSQIDTDRIGYLSIDMNQVTPEMAAGEYLWPRLVPGAIVVLDDYGWRPHIAQKHAWDAFAEKRGLRVLSMPTGQGILMKPAVATAP
jgi:O-methyltransferase